MTTVHAATKDAVFQASIEFIGTLTGMTPPPIEIAPAETFKPFADFTNRVCEIFEKQIVDALTAQRDAYAKAADEISAVHKVERDALKAELARPESTAVSMMRAENAELTAQLETLQYEVDAIPAIKAERDALKAELARPESTVVSLMRAENVALKDAARLALDALECSEAYVGCESWSPSMLREIQQVIAALKAVL